MSDDQRYPVGKWVREPKIDATRRQALIEQIARAPGLLSAAGRHVASNVAHIRYVEGSYDRHVLAENLITEDITFGYGGWAAPLEGPGLGVTVDPAALERMTVAREEVRLG